MAPSGSRTATCFLVALALAGGQAPTSTRAVPVTAATTSPATATVVLSSSAHDPDPCTLHGISIHSTPTYFEDPASGHAYAFAVCDGVSTTCFMHHSAYFPVLPIDCSVMVESRRLAAKSDTSFKPSVAKAKTTKSRAAHVNQGTKVKPALDKQKVRTVPGQKAVPEQSKAMRVFKTGTSLNRNTKPQAKSTKNPLKAAKGPLSRARPNATPKHATPDGKTKAATNTTGSRSADVICKHKGVRIYGHQTLGEEPGFYAVCDESVKPPKLTCYQDVGIADSPVPDPEVPCKRAPPVSSNTPSTKNKSGARQLLAHHPHDHLWPRGVVCYEIRHPEEPTRESVATTLRGLSAIEQDHAFAGIMSTYKATKNRRRELIQRIRNAMNVYQRNAGISFISIKDCPSRLDKEHICGGCSHSVRFMFEVNQLAPWFACWSHVGYLNNDPRRGDYSWQYVNLSPGCWNHSAILHELGHTLGMHHDHQHPDRTVIVDRAVAQADGVPESQFYILTGLVGEYDRHSIMHYRAGTGVCVPKKEHAETNFCDVNQSPAANNCVVPVTTDHCDPIESAKLGSRTLSEGDIRHLQQWYPRASSTPPVHADDDDAESDEEKDGKENWGIDKDTVKRYIRLNRGDASQQRGYDGHNGVTA